MNSEILHRDKQIIFSLKKGDAKAFEQIFIRYKAKVFYFTLKYLHSHEETEEIVQNTFVSLWEHRHLLDENKPVKNYLFKIAVNSIYNTLKRKAIHNKSVLHLLSKKKEIDNDLHKKVEENELLDILDKLINSLPLKQREVFRLSRWEGLSHNEIAARLGLSVRSVENHVYRALKYLKKNLKEEYYSTGS